MLPLKDRMVRLAKKEKIVYNRINDLFIIDHKDEINEALDLFSIKAVWKMLYDEGSIFCKYVYFTKLIHKYFPDRYLQDNIDNTTYEL